MESTDQPNGTDTELVKYSEGVRFHLDIATREGVKLLAVASEY